MARGGISQRGLDRLRREWQKRLNLQDWKIKARFVGEGVIPNKDLAQNVWFLAGKSADISILDPRLTDEENAARAGDVENSLVHELLHCHFAHFMSEEEVMATLQEQVIEAIATALVGLKREQRERRKAKRD